MREITSRQTEVLNFITDYINRNSYSPSVKEMADHFQITHRAIQDHVFALKRKGYLKSDYRKPRTLVVLKAV
jgi:repressor LexA